MFTNKHIQQLQVLFAAGFLRNLLPGSAPMFLQWFKLALIIQQ